MSAGLSPVVSHPFENPVVRYGLGVANAAIVVAVGFLFLDGLVRNLVFGMAALEVLVTPLILERAVD
jgi:hypothetical protein